jgi:hypothetical protein
LHSSKEQNPIEYFSIIGVPLWGEAGVKLVKQYHENQGVGQALNFCPGDNILAYNMLQE